MKKIIFKLILLSFIINGCSSSSDNPTPTNPCGNISSFTVTQQNETVTIALVSSATPLYYEVSVLSTSNLNNPDFGSINPMNTTTQTFPITSLGINPGGTYLFYIRTVCTDGSKSSWSSPKSVVINSFCYTPFSLGISQTLDGAEFHWTTNDNNTSYYQIEYGPHGFALGTGTNASVNNTYYLGMSMAANTVYDFYVKAYCTTALGWSSWAGPYTYLSTVNQNLCSVPSNLYTAIETTNSQTAWVSLHWTYNGETNFEYTVVNHGASVTSGIIYTADNTGWPTISRNRYNSYDFYIRAVCSNGNRTTWAGPSVISL